jgi:hypothetical protein
MRLPHLSAILALLAACSSSTSNPQSEPSPSTAPMLEVSEGDTVIVFMHKVRPEHRSHYESFMTEKWYPAAQKLASKDAAFADAFSRRWRLVPLEAGDDSLLSYVFVYPMLRGTSRSTWDIYREGGVSEEDVARDSTQWAEWARPEGGTVTVRDEY